MNETYECVHTVLHSYFKARTKLPLCNLNKASSYLWLELHLYRWSERAWWSDLFRITGTAQSGQQTKVQHSFWRIRGLPPFQAYTQPWLLFACILECWCIYFSDINSETEPLLLHLELINTEQSLLLLKCMKPEDFTTKSTHRLLVLY